MKVINNDFRVSIFFWCIIQALNLIFISETFLACVDDEAFVRTARITSSISLIINIALIPAYLLALGLISFFSAELSSVHLEKKDILQGLSQVSLVFIIYNVLKIFNTYYHYDILSDVNPMSESFEESIKLTKWAHLQRGLDLCVAFGAGLIFVLEINKKMKLAGYQWVIMFLSISIPLLLLSFVSFSMV